MAIKDYSYRNSTISGSIQIVGESIDVYMGNSKMKNQGGGLQMIREVRLWGT